MMTQQTNIADIVKPLEWENGAIFYYAIGTQYKVAAMARSPLYPGTGDRNYKLEQRHVVGRFLYLRDDFEPTFHKTIEDAKAAAFYNHCLDVEAYCNRYLDLTKLQPQPEPFWKPIEQCPKVEGAFYDLSCILNGRRIRVVNATFANGLWYKTDMQDDWGKPDMYPLVKYYGRKYKARLTVIAFAEIPACEVQS